MLLIAAALAEELNLALELCRDRKRVAYQGSGLWQATHQGAGIYFLRTGVGPARSGAKLKRLMSDVHPSRILIVGYAGALNPSLKVGDLVVAGRVSLIGEKPRVSTPLENLELSGSWELAEGQEILQLVKTAGAQMIGGDLLTSPYIIGEPRQKESLFRRFNADAIDMETAALARIAVPAGIPVSCVRSISDEAQDEFLAPFSYDPHSGPIGRAAKVVTAGNWIRRCRDWRERAAVARASLRKFLEVYLGSRPQTLDLGH